MPSQTNTELSVIQHIHTVWLGDNMNTLAQVCISDWEKQGYQYTVWTDKKPLVKQWIEECRFARECYKRKLYAFVSDYIRLKALQAQGGLYLDTDVTLFKDPFPLFNNLDFSVGYESKYETGTALIYARPESKILHRLIEFYENDIWSSSLYIGPSIQTHILFNEDISTKEKSHIYAKEYFFDYHPDKHTMDYIPGENCYAIHWFNNSWSKKSGLGFVIGKHKGILGRFYEWQKQLLRKSKK